MITAEYWLLITWSWNWVMIFLYSGLGTWFWLQIISSSEQHVHVSFKKCTMVYKCQQSQHMAAPVYLSEMCVPVTASTRCQCQV